MGVTTPSSSLKSLFTGTTDAGGRIGGGDNLSSTTRRGDNCCGAFLRVDRRLVKARAVRLPWILSRIAPTDDHGGFKDPSSQGGDDREAIHLHSITDVKSTPLMTELI